VNNLPLKREGWGLGATAAALMEPPRTEMGSDLHVFYIAWDCFSLRLSLVIGNWVDRLLAGSMGNGSGGYRAATWRDYTADANVNIGTGVNSVSVLLLIKCPGVHIYYRFHRSIDCWKLYAIDDRST
jgi:hypothetical protein